MFFIKDLLSGRKFSVRVDTALSKSVAQGEGSVVSITLLALGINAIVSSLPDGVSYSMYVDDLAIWGAASRMLVADRCM